jgi:peptidoglycan/LPS O-acetylase OafA/YrhL
MNEKNHYRLDIEGLRALAVMLVLIFHFKLVPFGKAGFLGVDIFFVISGYLITLVIVRQFETDRFSLLDFYLRRVRRLAPALFVTLALSLLFGALILLPHELIELSRQTLWSQLYVANIYYWRTINYFGLHADSVYLLHTWSLGVEEQFYLFYPLVLFFLHRFWRKWLWSAITVMFIVSLFLNVALVGMKREAVFYLLPTRAWELLAGALVFRVSQSWRRIPVVNNLLGFAGLATILIAVGSFGPDTQFPGYFAMLPVAGSAALILSGQHSSGIVTRLLSQKLVVYIGAISYALYLVHWPVNVFAQQVLQEGYSFHWRLAMFGLSLSIASLIFHFVEQPIRQRHVVASARTLVKSYAFGLVTTIVLYFIVQNTGGLPQRFDDRVVTLAAYAEDKSPSLSECEFGRDLSAQKDRLPVCAIGIPNQPPSWLIFGDSHAWAGFSAFDQWLRLRGESGVMSYRHGCPPINGVNVFGDNGLCRAFNDTVLQFAQGQSSIDRIVLVSSWMQSSEGRLTARPDQMLLPEDSDKLFRERFAETVSIFATLGKKVFIWEPVPGAKRSVPQALAERARSGKSADLEFSLEEYRAIFSNFFAALSASRTQVTGSFSPSALLCSTDRCLVDIEGAPLYFDNAHISKSSSRWWIEALEKGAPRNTAGEPPD